MKSFLLYFYILLNIFGCFLSPVYAEIILPADIVEGQDSAKSWIKNSHFEKNVNSVSSYSDSAGTSPVDGTGGSSTITCTRTTSSPISGDGSLLITKDAANRQGQGCSIPFTIDRGDRATMQAIVLPYEVASGTFAAGTDTTNSDLVMWVYDITNSVLIPVQGTGRFYSNTADYFFGYFQTNSNSTSYRLIFHQALTGTSAYTLKVDNVKVFKSKFALGTPISDFQSCTFTGAWVSNTTYTCRSRRVGDSKEYDGLVATSGAPTSASLTVTLPSGDVIDTAKISSTGNKKIGSGTISDTGTDEYDVGVFYSSTTAVTLRVLKKSAGNDYIDYPQVTQAVPMTWANTDYVNFKFSVPIVGLSSSTQISDGFSTAEVSFVANVSTTAATTSAPFVYTTVVTNKGGGYSSSTGKFTAPSSGTYFFKVTSYTGSTLSEPICYLNGTSYSRGPAQKDSSTPSIGTCIASMTAGDTMEIRPSGSATAAGDLTLNNFSGFKIGSSQTVSMDTAYCALYTGTPTGTLANALNKATVPTKVSDTHNAYSSGDYTVSSSGFYSITAQTTQSATYANGSAAVTSIAINGTSSYIGIESAFAAGATTLSPHVSVHGVPLVAGQTVSVYTLNNGTSPTFTTPLTGANYFSICKDK